VTAGPGSQPAPVAGLDDEGPVPWQASAAAIALVCRRKAACREISRSAVIGDSAPGHVFAALEAIADALLEVMTPQDGGAFFLQELGLYVARKGEAGRPAASGYLHRCRWTSDGPAGRCAAEQAFPGVRDVPPFCAGHIAELDRWVASRAAQQACTAPAWIEWARRRAEDVRAFRRLLGERPDGVTRHTPRGGA
jgi:hypothetical protein